MPGEGLLAEQIVVHAVAVDPPYQLSSSIPGEHATVANPLGATIEAAGSQQQQPQCQQAQIQPTEPQPPTKVYRIRASL